MTAGADTVRLFVPGRICLFGEHSDWAGQHGLHPGYCLVVGTDQGLWADARRDDAFSVQTFLPDREGRSTNEPLRISCPFREEALLRAAQDQQEFFRHCAGTACQMLTGQQVPGGIDLRIIAMDLPLKKGVSSSAAVCILVARAFDALYGLGLFPHELMETAYEGERLTGSQCGRMDQACIYGKTPVLLSFRSEDVRVEPITPGGKMHLFFVDLAGQKDTVRILEDLQRAYPNQPPLQRALGPDSERIVRQAHQALLGGDEEAFGRLMTEAQENFDRHVAPHSPGQLTSPLLHELLGWEPLQEHIHGGKGVGSQGDGTAQFVARSEHDRDTAMAKIQEAFPAMRCFPLTLNGLPAPPHPAG